MKKKTKKPKTPPLKPGYRAIQTSVNLSLLPIEEMKDLRDWLDSFIRWHEACRP